MEDPRATIAARIKPAQTQAEELRQYLRRLEKHVGQIGGRDAVAAAETLALFDQVRTLVEAVSGGGGDLAAEMTRYETVSQQFDKKKAKFLKELGGSEALATLRQERHPEDAPWWWQVDTRLAEERRIHRTRALRQAGIAAAILTVLGGLYAIFLRPDAATRERLRHESAAEQALTQGDLALALSEAEMALTQAPGDPELLILRGVTLALQERTDEAEADFALAEAAVGTRDRFLVERSQTYMVANRTGLALEDALAVIEMDPEMAMGYMIAGNAYAVQGEYLQAVASYERASELAEAAGETQLQGMARYQLANLMMAPPVNIAQQPTPED